VIRLCSPSYCYGQTLISSFSLVAVPIELVPAPRDSCRPYSHSGMAICLSRRWLYASKTHWGLGARSGRWSLPFAWWTCHCGSRWGWVLETSWACYPLLLNLYSVDHCFGVLCLDCFKLYLILFLMLEFTKNFYLLFEYCYELFWYGLLRFVLACPHGSTTAVVANFGSNIKIFVLPCKK
jgi:hypothetical protein